jgi:hypothetical protein
MGGRLLPRVGNWDGASCGEAQQLDRWHPCMYVRHTAALCYRPYAKLQLACCAVLSCTVLCCTGQGGPPQQCTVCTVRASLGPAASAKVPSSCTHGVSCCAMLLCRTRRITTAAPCLYSGVPHDGLCLAATAKVVRTVPMSCCAVLCYAGQGGSPQQRAVRAVGAIRVGGYLMGAGGGGLCESSTQDCR